MKETIILSIIITIIIYLVAIIYSNIEKSNKYQNRNRKGQFKKVKTKKTHVLKETKKVEYYYIPVKSGNTVWGYIKSEKPNWVKN